MKKAILIALALVGLTACQTTKERPAVPAMQMPPKPEGTARIVLFRTDAKTGAPSNAPVVTLNGQAVGPMADETLYIQDVHPGRHEVALVASPGDQQDSVVFASTGVQASIDAGDEWYVEAVANVPCRRGTQLISDDIAPAVPPILDFVSLALEQATRQCTTIYQVRPVWPQSSWHIDPLLAKTGAKPFERMPDRRLPLSGLSWWALEQAIQNHLASNADAYRPAGKYGSSSLLFRTMDVLEERAGADDHAGIVEIRLGYLDVDESTIVGSYVEKRRRYTFRREGDALAVTGWEPLGPE